MDERYADYSYQDKVDTLIPLHANEIGGGKKTVAEEIADYKISTLDSAYAAKSIETIVSQHSTRLQQLNSGTGSESGDINKSIRTIAAEEVAKIVANADASYDTLKEIADWILNDAIDTAMIYTKTEADNKFATNETVNGAAFLGGESESSTTANFDPQTDTVWNIPQVLGSSAKAQARANIGAQEQLVSGTNVKTVNNESILGQGNLTIQGSGEANVIETVKVNGTALVPDANKAVDITVPAAVTEQTVSGWGFTKSTGNVSSTAVNTIVRISQSDYDALVQAQTVDSNTLYLITES